MLFQSVERHPVIAVVACRVREEANVVGRGLALVAPFLEKGVEPLPDQGARAMPGIFRDHEQSGRAFRVEEIRFTFRREAFPLQLRTGTEGRFELSWVVLSIVSG